MLAVQIGPADTLALHYLLTMHLLQNVALAEWGPLLIVLGLTSAMAHELLRIPGSARAHASARRAADLARRPTSPGTLPWAYDAALRHQWTILHAEHACYFVAGVLVWWPVVHGSYSSGTKALYLFGAFVLASPARAAARAPAQGAVYDFYEHVPRLWGLSPLSDQQIAG